MPYPPPWPPLAAVSTASTQRSRHPGWTASCQASLSESASLTAGGMDPGEREGDRKSTRLNSSHVAISYAVFCWKKKINTIENHPHYKNIQTRCNNTLALPS